MNATIYTINTCNFCKSAKDFFTSKNIPFTEKNVEQDKTALDEMLKLSDNFAGVPFTVITKDDGTTVSLKGFTLQEFEHAASNAVAMDLNTPAPSNVADNIPTTPTVPNMPVDMPAPAVEPAPTIAAPMSPASNVADVTPMDSPTPLNTPAVETAPAPMPAMETPAVVEPVSTPEPVSPMTPAVTEPGVSNSGTEEDVDKKLDTLLQSLQSKTAESIPSTVETAPMAPMNADPMPQPSSMNTGTPEPTPSSLNPTPDTNMNNPLYQAAESVPSVEPTPQVTPQAVTTPTDTVPPAPVAAEPVLTPAMDTPSPAASTGPAPTIPDFKPRT